MTDTTPAMRSRRYLKSLTATPGDFVGEGVSGYVVEAAAKANMPPPVRRHPSDQIVDEQFSVGPTFLMRLPGAYVDPETGFVWDARRRFVRESAMVGKYAELAETLYPRLDFDAAYPIREYEVRVMSNQRSANYCRWWLDSLSKLFLFDKYATKQERPHLTITPPLQTTFQRASLELMGVAPGPALPSKRLVRGDLLISAGLTYGGGQNISPLVRDFGSWVLGKSGLGRLGASRGKRLYVTRSRASMRRILNEPELLADLEARGFDIVALEALPLERQIARFASADIVVSVHGAGLTNVMFCRPGTLLVEIFPDVGVHSSAFRRIAAHVGMDYALYAGPSASAGGETNLRNVDLSVDPAHFLGFLDGVLNPASVEAAA